MVRTITINETASTTVAPDYVNLSFTIEATDKIYRKATESVANKIRQINLDLEKIGFDKESLKTVHYSVQPKSNLVRDRKGSFQSQLEGYKCIHRLKIEFPLEIERLGNTMETISKSLVEPQMNISFTVKDKHLICEGLLKEITEKAKKKAQIMCEAAGAVIGKLVTVQYHENNMKSIIDNDVTCLMAPPRVGESVTGPLIPSATPVQLQPNDINISDSATFVWEIE